MTQLSQYLIECDSHFYRDYAVPLITKNPNSYDLDDFESLTTGNDSINRTMEEAYHDFQYDKDAQYEMNPRFGRYVWDIGDQWYQKWTMVFSVEHMWNWVQHGATRSTEKLDQPFDVLLIQPWLDHITTKHRIHTDHRCLLEEICQYVIKWHQSNRQLTLSGTFKLSCIPFFPPSWFTNKEQQNRNNQEGLSPSYLAKFVPPYRLDGMEVPERWDQVFLKGLTVDQNHHFNIDPMLIASAIPILGLTVHYDEHRGYSRLMLVMKKAAFGNLEDYVERELPMDYLKPCQLALSITKDIKDLHWSFVHGNIHPRNVLLNYADYVGELVDITFMQRSNNNKSSKSWAGRWPYVAPEVISTGLSTAADMYALGIILWQLVSRVTFPDNALVDPSVYRIEPIPGILEEWESLYIDCLHTDPDKRPNAYTMYRRLTQLAARQQQSPTPLSTMTTDYMKARRSEIQGFLDRESTFIYGSPCNVTNNYTTYNSLVHVGDHVLTTSITRPSHKELESYPNLIQHFPPYS